MKKCAYCDEEGSQTKEHVIPNWYKLDKDGETFNARSPFDHTKGAMVVRDVCARCNNNTLSKLDDYAKGLYDQYFAVSAFYDDKIEFCYDGDLLLRWLLKISYNSARAQGADTKILHEYRKIILGETPVPDKLHCWLYLQTATMIDKSGGIIREAYRKEQGNESVLEPQWFRIIQMRLSNQPRATFVQRGVIINSFTFIIVALSLYSISNDNEFDNWKSTFNMLRPNAKLIKPGLGTLSIQAKDEHAVGSIYPSMLNYPTRYFNHSDTLLIQAHESRGENAPIVIQVARDLIEAGDINSVLSTLYYTISTRENAWVYMQRVAIMVDGYDDDPRGLWQIPEAKEYFRTVFSQFPFILWIAHPECHLLELVAKCWISEPIISESHEKQRLKEFLELSFDALNDLCHVYAFGEEKNREISEVTFKTIFGDDFAL